MKSPKPITIEKARDRIFSAIEASIKQQVKRIRAAYADNPDRGREIATRWRKSGGRCNLHPMTAIAMLRDLRCVARCMYHYTDDYAGDAANNFGKGEVSAKVLIKAIGGGARTYWDYGGAMTVRVHSNLVYAATFPDLNDMMESIDDTALIDAYWNKPAVIDAVADQIVRRLSPETEACIAAIKAAIDSGQKVAPCTFSYSYGRATCAAAFRVLKQDGYITVDYRSVVGTPVYRKALSLAQGGAA